MEFLVDVLMVAVEFSILADGQLFKRWPIVTAILAGMIAILIILWNHKIR